MVSLAPALSAPLFSIFFFSSSFHDLNFRIDLWVLCLSLNSSAYSFFTISLYLSNTASPILSLIDVFEVSGDLLSTFLNYLASAGDNFCNLRFASSFSFSILRIYLKLSIALGRSTLSAAFFALSSSVSPKPKPKLPFDCWNS